MLGRFSCSARASVLVLALVAVVLPAAARAADTTPPDTLISDYDVAYDHASYWFRSPDDPAATFRCSLDGAAPSECVSPAQYTGLAVGWHTFEVVAVDAAGNVDPTPENRSWYATEPLPPPPVGPANDGFFGAEPVSGVEGTVSGTNVNASADWNEPYTPVRGGASVWYTWTAPRSGSVTFAATSSAFQPTVSIFEGDAPDRLVLWSSGVGSATVAGRQNASYRIAVDGENGGTGPFDLSWAFAPTGGPANDYFADAATIDGASGSVTGSTANATAEPGEPVHSGLSCCLNDNEHSIWYRWTAPVSGEAFFTTAGSSYDTVLRAYTGTSVDALGSPGVYWNDANPWTTWSRVDLRNVAAGTTYYLAVDAANGETGAVQLNWRTVESTGDLIPPTVQILAPEPNAPVQGQVVFLADASDNETVDRVVYSIAPNSDAGEPWYIGEAYGPPYEVDFDSSVLQPGVYDVLADAYDASGNSASFTSTFVVPAPPPTITVPKNMTVEAAGPTGVSVKFSAKATDYTGAAVPVTCKPSSGARFPLGATKVSCTATDSYGNTVGKSFTITVVDTTPPAVTVPADYAVNAVSPAGVPVSFTATATDLVSGTVAASCTPASGNSFQIGDTKVSCTAIDRAGNPGTAAFTVHVKGAAEQLEDTRAAIASLGLRAALAAKLDGQLADIAKQVASGRLSAACGGIVEFRTNVSQQAGKGLTMDQAAALDTTAARIAAAAGC
jgi:HYR domain-containing protein